MTTYNNCHTCGEKTTNAKFCSRSCAAKHNNKGVRRHGKKPTVRECLRCSKETTNSKFCSHSCCSLYHRPTPTEEERKRNQRHWFMKYYTKKKNQTPADADMDKIKKIYQNCPDGYEVDHIIPISKGGLHHQDNLQHLPISENRRKGNKIL